MVKPGVFFESDKSHSAGPSEHWRHSAFLSRVEEGASAGRARGSNGWEEPVVPCMLPRNKHSGFAGVWVLLHVGLGDFCVCEGKGA